MARGSKITKVTGKRGETVYKMTVDVGVDGNGKRKQKKLTASSQRELEKMAAQILADVSRGTYFEPAKMTVGGFMDYWLTNYGESHLKPRTYEGYVMIINKHLKPSLGDIPLPKLMPLHIQDYYKNALTSGRTDGKVKSLGAGLSTTTVLQHHRILHEALHHAVKWQLIPRNPADAVEPPKKKRQEMKALVGEQINKLLDAVKGTYIYMPVLLASATGMRMSEILGLTWAEVNFKAGTLRVVQTQQRRGGQTTYGTPKNDKSRRQLELASPVIEILKKHQKEQKKWKMRAGENWQNKNSLICTLEDGSPVNNNTLSSVFRDVVDRLGYDVRFHDLRHSAATLLLQAGVHPKVVAEMLGHSTVNLTLNVYSHVLPGMQKEAASKLATAIFSR